VGEKKEKKNKKGKKKGLGGGCTRIRRWGDFGGKRGNDLPYSTINPQELKEKGGKT